MQKINHMLIVPVKTTLKHPRWNICQRLELTRKLEIFSDPAEHAQQKTTV